MCGILGAIWPDEINHEQQVRRTLNAMARLQHRGPDGGGYYHGEMITLAHTRLAILDLRPISLQPFVVEGSDDVLVFNGEIFNYRELRLSLERDGTTFITQSDTEVLYHWLQRYGIDGIATLEGQFAFAYYQPHLKCLTLARDPIGEKPLYYATSNEGFYFASEIKGIQSLLNKGLELCPDALSEVIDFWAPVQQESAFRDISAVPPGGFIVLENGRHFSGYYRVIESEEKVDHLKPKDVEEKLIKAIERRMVSDVPVSVFISGGLDSSIVAQQVNELSPQPVNSYSISFVDQDYDEFRFQQLLSKKLGTEHNTLRLNYDDIVDNYEAALMHAESPTPRTGFVGLFLLNQMVKRNGDKVVLTGEGADEVFLGYDIFREVTIKKMIREGATFEQVTPLLANLNQFMKHNPDFNKYLGLKYANYKSLATKQDDLSSHHERFNLGNLAQRMVIGRQNNGNRFQRWQYYLQEKYPYFVTASEMEKAQIIETESLLSGHLLSVQGDRVSMANSIETRAPFLDSDLIRLLFKYKRSLLLNTSGTEKALLKDLFRDRLPKEIVQRTKFPYRAPDSLAFLSSKGQAFCQSVIAGATSDVVDVTKLQRFLHDFFLKKQSSPRENHAFLVLLSALLLEQKFTSKPAAEELFLQPHYESKKTRYGRLQYFFNLR